MSITAKIIATEFVDLKTNEITYGVRICADYISFYIDHWGIPADDDMVLLEDCLIAVKACSVRAVLDFFHYIQDLKGSVTINGNLYSWEQIKDVFKECGWE
jgi:hypothetical protein